MTALAHELAAVPTWAVLITVFAIPALEASTLLGLVVPGESAVLLGGVLAQQGRMSLLAVMAAAVLGAIVGDNVGYAVGARLGPALLSRASDSTARRARRAEVFVERFGGAAVLFGRCTAFLRALVPSLAGASGVRLRSFVVYNVTGATIWGVGVAGLGFLAGGAYGRAARYLGVGETVASVVLIAGAVLLVHFLSGRRQDPPAADPSLSRPSHPRHTSVEATASARR